MSRCYKGAVAAGLAGVITLGASGALATSSGTRVQNTVTVSFSVDSVAQDDETAQVGFVVDRKIDMLVADQGSINNARPKQTNRQLVYKVTNEGNDAQKYDIDVALTQNFTGGDVSLDTNTDVLGASEYRVYISTDATLDIPGDTVYNPTGFSLAATPGAFDSGGTGDEFHVIIVVNVPSDAVDTDNVKFSVTAVALNDTDDGALTEDKGNGLDDAGTPANAVDIVFADGAKTAGSDGTDAIEDGKHTDNATLTVASASLTATKAVTIVDENTQGTFTCATDADPAEADATQGAMPGACLEYTITIANGAAASESATNISISDTLPAGVTFAGFTSVTGWGSSEDHTAGVVTATLAAALAPNNSAVLGFRVTVD